MPLFPVGSVRLFQTPVYNSSTRGVVLAYSSSPGAVLGRSWGILGPSSGMNRRTLFTRQVGSVVSDSGLY